MITPLSRILDSVGGSGAAAAAEAAGAWASTGDASNISASEAVPRNRPVKLLLIVPSLGRARKCSDARAGAPSSPMA